MNSMRSRSAVMGVVLAKAAPKAVKVEEDRALDDDLFITPENHVLRGLWSESR
jgi:hypothetical protein